MTVSDTRIRIHFDIHQPIELMDLTLSFSAFAKQYRKFLCDRMRQEGKKPNDSEIKLYITKIENNCILAELAGASQIMGSLFAVMDYVNIFVDFIKNTNDSIQYFKNLVKKDVPQIKGEGIPYSSKQCADLSDFLKIVSEQGNLRLSAAQFVKESPQEKILVSYTYSTEEASEARKGTLLAQSILDETGEADHKGVLMYFYQANIDESKSDGKTSEKAVIKSICAQPLPVHIVSELDRDRIFSLKDDPQKNIFKASYLVDVNVETDKNNQPRVYRILKIHKILPDEPDENLV